MTRVVRRLLVTAFVLATVSATTGAQTPSTAAADARSIVGYIDVTPASRNGFVAAFRRYRDTSAGERGYVRFELFEQTGRPAHFVVIETWRDQAGSDMHATASSSAQFHAAVEPMRTSGFDQRPYKPMNVSPAAGAAPKGSVWLITHVDIGPGGGDAPAILTRQAEASRADAGSVRFDVLQHAMRANHFTLVEAWKDQRAYDAHAAAAHTRRYRDELQPLSGSPVDERVFTLVE